MRLLQDVAPLVQRAYGQKPLVPPGWRDTMLAAATAADAQARRRVERARIPYTPPQQFP
ncbi:hypothetical protein [Kibdelosporangium aridum]|uniref:hypothetical protein n=1 Tax=Kibdelosporangium aridum TaxID=2030 RepID=UPI0035E79C91